MTISIEHLVFRWEDFPPVTADLPGIGGIIRSEVEDFLVDEIALYRPDGNGSHTYVRVEKRNQTTQALITALVNEGVDEKSIGVAGLKDKYAITRQWLSVPNRFAHALSALEALPGVELLERSRHKNKLGLGHLVGNRFKITVRRTDPEAEKRARAILDRLYQIGVPNYFGPQRFGRFGTNAVDGYKLLQGQWVPGGTRLKRFFVSALQALIFNAILAERYRRNLYRRVIPGDWARKHDTGGTFKVEGVAEEIRAFDLRISATFPLFGRKVGISEGVAGEIERQVLQQYQVQRQDFSVRKGTRRISRIPLDEVVLAAEQGVLRLDFSLPKGAYATSFLREVMKVEVDAPSPRTEMGSDDSPG
ncbi:MAG: tRNA pseudouridine(13) synthase TruD [Trueperaceae bacterium]|nr:MAG: tRNA pseudouridine(13) synthase TruD [Trueperaceae bacterium]